MHMRMGNSMRRCMEVEKAGTVHEKTSYRTPLSDHSDLCQTNRIADLSQPLTSSGRSSTSDR